MDKDTGQQRLTLHCMTWLLLNEKGILQIYLLCLEMAHIMNNRVRMVSCLSTFDAIQKDRSLQIKKLKQTVKLN